MYVHDTHEHAQLSLEDSWKEGFNDRKMLSTAQSDPTNNTLNRLFFTLFIL